MKQQVVVIHGGRTFDTYKEYLRSLKTREVSLDNFKPQSSWREALEKELGRNFELLTPKMPNPNNAVYQEWKMWFEKMDPFIKNNVILIGHSLGGIFLAKYLAETNFRKKIKALMLVAAPFDDCTKESLGSFKLPKSLQKLSGQCKDIHLIFSKNDPVVPIREIKKYEHALPNSSMLIFKNKEHFNQSHFSELVKIIKNL